MLKGAKIGRSSLCLTTTYLLGPEDLIKMLNAATSRGVHNTDHDHEIFVAGYKDGSLPPLIYNVINMKLLLIWCQVISWNLSLNLPVSDLERQFQ